MNRQYKVDELVEKESSNSSHSEEDSNKKRGSGMFNFFEKQKDEQSHQNESHLESNVSSNYYVDSPYLSVPIDNMYHYLLEPAKGRFPLKNLVLYKKNYPKNVQNENTPNTFPFTFELHSVNNMIKNPQKGEAIAYQSQKKQTKLVRKEEEVKKKLHSYPVTLDSHDPLFGKIIKSENNGIRNFDPSVIAQNFVKKRLLREKQLAGASIEKSPSQLVGEGELNIQENQKQVVAQTPKEKEKEKLHSSVHSENQDEVHELAKNVRFSEANPYSGQKRPGVRDFFRQKTALDPEEVSLRKSLENIDPMGIRTSISKSFMEDVGMAGWGELKRKYGVGLHHSLKRTSVLFQPDIEKREAMAKHEEYHRNILALMSTLLVSQIQYSL